jgi:hypothetical protein
VQREPDTIDIDALAQDFRESQKGRNKEKEKEQENGIEIEEEKCRVKT